MKPILTLLATALTLFYANANNILVDNATLINQDSTASPANTHVAFDLSWDNSWRVSAGPSNWDAAWVFVKYQVQNDVWRHATLSTTGGHHSVTNNNGTTVTIEPSADGKGVFIYRSGNGTGSLNLQEVLLRWNYGTDGVAHSDNLQVKVFAIEMVYIPQGPYFLGDGNIATAPSTNGFMTNSTGNTLPCKIESEAAIAFSGTGTTCYDMLFPSTGTYTLPAAFPKGFGAFYTMKYEVSQRQYVDFFNTLPNVSTPRNNRYLSPSSTYRNDIFWDGQVNSDAVINNSNSGDRACNYIYHDDVLAYSDWAALSPMTEMEYEKMSRGCDNTNPASPVPVFPTNGEYAWGNTTINPIPNSTSSLVNDGLVNENLVNGSTVNYNAHYGIPTSTSGQIRGPIRNGIFAAKNWTSDQRTQSGGSYYGVMELSGDLFEIVMKTRRWSSTSTSYITSFNGSHGDGALDANGNANEGWPSYLWGGFRGGTWYTGTTNLRTSDRSTMTSEPSSRNQYNGFRAVRRM